MNAKDGGPAFPCQAVTTKTTGSGVTGDPFVVHQSTTDGMSLRDYFAAKALAELMREAHENNVEGSGDLTTLDEVAIDAYRMADAMLAERSKP